MPATHTTILPSPRQHWPDGDGRALGAEARICRETEGRRGGAGSSTGPGKPAAAGKRFPPGLGDGGHLEGQGGCRGSRPTGCAPGALDGAATLRTAPSRHWDSRTAPQHPKNPTIIISAPAPTSTYSPAGQKPTQSEGQQHIWDGWRGCHPCRSPTTGKRVTLLRRPG